MPVEIRLYCIKNVAFFTMRLTLKRINPLDFSCVNLLILKADPVTVKIFYFSLYLTFCFGVQILVYIV